MGMHLDPMQFVFIMMSALLAAALWLLFASHKGLPVSTTHAIIGGIVGSALCMAALNGVDSVALIQWDKLGEIALSWILSPVLGGIVSYLLFSRIKKKRFRSTTLGLIIRSKASSWRRKPIKKNTACFLKP